MYEVLFVDDDLETAKEYAELVHNYTRLKVMACSSKKEALEATRRNPIAICVLEPIPKVVESDESFVIPCAAPESSTGGAEMWKPEHRRAAARHGLRYPSDLTDAEWVLVEPMIPPAKRGGRRREVNVREVLNAIFYVLSTGCQWQALPKDLPPKSTAHSYFSCGIGTEHWNASTTHSMSPPASARAGKPAQRPRSSTVKAPKRLKKGLHA